MTVRLLLLGSPLVQHGGESIALPFERRTQLLAFLALKRAWVGRAELAACCGPISRQNSRTPTCARRCIACNHCHGRSRLNARRRAPFSGRHRRVRLRVGAAREAHRRRFGAAPWRAAGGFDDDQNEAWSSWLNFERDRLRVAWRRRCCWTAWPPRSRRVKRSTCRALLDADRFDEAALRAHMSWLARDGQISQARHAYRQFVERLERDLGLAASSELESSARLARYHPRCASGDAHGDAGAGRRRFHRAHR